MTVEIAEYTWDRIVNINVNFIIHCAFFYVFSVFNFNFNVAYIYVFLHLSLYEHEHYAEAYFISG